jgi:hypothetical protein
MPSGFILMVCAKECRIQYAVMNMKNPLFKTEGLVSKNNTYAVAMMKNMQIGPNGINLNLNDFILMIESYS